MTIRITRRGAMGAVLAAPALRAASAQGGALNVLAHRVHQNVATGAQGGDVAAAWGRATGNSVPLTEGKKSATISNMTRRATAIIRAASDRSGRRPRLPGPPPRACEAP